MLKYTLAHVGINAANRDEAEKAARMFETLFGFAVKEGNSSIFAGDGVEVMKEPYKGKNGHIGIGTPDVAAAWAELEARGFSVAFMTAFGFNDACRRYHISFDASRSDALDALIAADLLVIDDLGTESILRNVTLEYLYTVISERMNAGRHTLITTNLSPAALADRYGERIVSRLFDGRVCLSVALTGKDLRRA